VIATSSTAAPTVYVYMVSDRTGCSAHCRCIVCIHGPCIHRPAPAPQVGLDKALARFRNETKRLRFKRPYFEGALPAERTAQRKPASAGRRKPLARPRSHLPRPMRRAADVAVQRS